MAQLAPLAAHPRRQLDAWHAEFMQRKIRLLIVEDEQSIRDILAELSSRLRFLDPQGFGMEAVVDVCERPQRLSLQLVGEIREGRPVPDSPLHATPARETYRFTPQPDGSTQLAVQLQAWDSGFLDFLKDTWPLALQRLKALAESTH